MAAALATLPWVEQTSIVADRRTRQARFTVTDRAKFDLAEVERVVLKAGYPKTKLLTGPTG
ncbi:MAG: hypothetical protein C0501_06085 [Isosphaera sp.]|nr:hypothetical protein [Isosphaera sp.]